MRLCEEKIYQQEIIFGFSCFYVFGNGIRYQFRAKHPGVKFPFPTVLVGKYGGKKIDNIRNEKYAMSLFSNSIIKMKRFRERIATVKLTSGINLE